MLAGRASIIAETVFSHSSKVELVRAAAEAGYLVHLHVVLLPEDAAVERVPFRISQGGHPVSETKIRERYARLWPLVAQARGLATVAAFYDNSRARNPYRMVAVFEHGLPRGRLDWPLWTPNALL